jgi:secretion/DNA translocation related TadE-like protein
VTAAGRDRGSASLWVLASGLVVLLLGVGAAHVGTAMIARHRALAAADLGALAGAGSAYAGESVACAHAARLVAANHARLVGCVLSGLDVTVTAEVDLAGPAGRVLTARAVSRAGPIRATWAT